MKDLKLKICCLICLMVIIWMISYLKQGWNQIIPYSYQIITACEKTSADFVTLYGTDYNCQQYLSQFKQRKHQIPIP